MKQQFGFRGVEFEMPIRLQEETPSNWRDINIWHSGQGRHRYGYLSHVVSFFLFFIIHILAICNGLEFFLFFYFWWSWALFGLAMWACRQWGLLPSCSAEASPCCGFSCCRAQALGTGASVSAVYRLSSRSFQALLPRGMGDLPRPGIKLKPFPDTGSSQIPSPLHPPPHPCSHPQPTPPDFLQGHFLRKRFLTPWSSQTGSGLQAVYFPSRRTQMPLTIQSPRSLVWTT